MKTLSYLEIDERAKLEELLCGEYILSSSSQDLKSAEEPIQPGIELKDYNAILAPFEKAACKTYLTGWTKS